VIYITLDRPLVFLQPVAVDRAILFWLSYKNAWEYWTEQRLNLNKEVLIATEQVSISSTFFVQIFPTNVVSAAFSTYL